MQGFKLCHQEPGCHLSLSFSSATLGTFHSETGSPLVSGQLWSQYVEQSELSKVQTWNHFVFSPIISFKCTLMHLLSLSLVIPWTDLKSFWSLSGIKKSRPAWSSLNPQSHIQFPASASPLLRLTCGLRKLSWGGGIVCPSTLLSLLLLPLLGSLLPPGLGPSSKSPNPD